MKVWCRWLTSLVLLLAFHGCATQSAAPGTFDVPIPGGMYGWGSDQGIEDFADVAVAQSELLMRGDHGSRMWQPITPTKYEAERIGGLRSYFPMRARWKLKDGREFILQSIDTAAIVRDYFSKHALFKVQWERENRAFAVGDRWPTLVYDIKGDSLRLRWVLPINRTPVSQRTPDRREVIEREVYPIATIKGQPTSGLNFDARYEPRK